MKSAKTRRESGRAYNKYYDPEEGAYNEQYWDDWNDHRDGFRDVGRDRTKFTPKHIAKEHWRDEPRHDNRKLTKLKIRRHYKKNKHNV